MPAHLTKRPEVALGRNLGYPGFQGTGSRQMDVEFGSYRLKRAERLLLGPKGPVELSARSFDIIAKLLERPDEVVGKTELFDAVWPGMVVEENTLQVHISALRKALDAGMIMTVHGRGYKYAGPRPVPAQAADDASEAAGEMPMPPKPSIAVLPFDNISGDPAQEYISDGVTENIITGLSRFRDLLVIASNSTFAYKGKGVGLQEVSRALGARFVLEGSVQKSSERIRVTARLIDGMTGQHLWSERYDRGVEDILAVQDDVTDMIVSQLATAYGGRLRKAWQGSIGKIGPKNLRAYDYHQRGLDTYNRFTKDDVIEAREWFRKAIEIDPGYGKPYAKIAWSHLTDVNMGWSANDAGSLATARDFADLAIAHDDDEAWGHWALAGYHLYCGQHDRAVAEYSRALELNPNDADVLNDFGQCLSYAGRAADGVEVVRRAMRLNPHHPEYWKMQFGPILFDARQYEEAIATLQSLRSLDTILAQLYLAASHAALGHAERAREAVARISAFRPSATITHCTAPSMAPYSNPVDLQHFRENLRKAGLPE